VSEKSEALRLAENLENPWWGMTASPSGLPEVSLVAVAALRADAARLLREQHARLLREQHAAPSEDIEALRLENERLREKCDELDFDKERWYRMAELHCSTIDRLKTSMREAMAMLDKHEPEPAGAFAVLLLALNPELQSAKNAALRQEVPR
jgi:hypothetical protein